MPEATLNAIPIFHDLDEPALKALGALCEERTVDAGEYLYRYGVARTEMFFVCSGEVEILRDLEDDTMVIANLGEGNFLGEGMLLDETLHTTSCRASVRSTVLVMKRSDMDQVFNDDPETARKVLTAVARVVAYRLRTANYGHAGKPGTIDERGTVRMEHDLLGDRPLPGEAYYGIQTLRAVENFPITGIQVGHFPNFVRAFAMVKKAAARANFILGYLNDDIAVAIGAACDEIIDGNFHHHFVVDMIQGGAGTSTNMNANEVIANRALEIMGHHKGEYEIIHPNNHVNLSQSTNDAYPTAIRLGILLTHRRLTNALEDLRSAFRTKAEEFADVIKMGRTQLQDAVPMTLGQEFGAFASTIGEDIQRADEMVRLFREINLGATAIGTGINTDPDYSKLAIAELAKISGQDFVQAADLVEATSDMGAFITFSGVLKRIAVKISKICNDLRLLSSGPRTGLNEINLPAMQPGSSIMPGKVNPVIPEAMNQVAFQVIGNDLTVTMAAESGQLQLNVMEPVLALNILQSMRILRNAIPLLADRCVKGITANRERCRELVEGSIGIITAVNPYIGYENSTRLAKNALETGRSVMELIIEEGLMTETELADILKPENMTKPRRMERKGG